MVDRLSLCDNVAIVTRNLRLPNDENDFCPGGAWKEGTVKMAVQLLLQVMMPERFRDAVKQQLA